jgi:DNA-binding MarR family transcriptional regulator
VDSEYKQQVNELSKIWHSMILTSKYKEIESKFYRIQRLSTAELSILRIIYEKEDVIIKDIVEILKIPKSTLTNTINRLEKYNIIERAISNKDKRSYKLILTEEGILTQEDHIEFEKEVYRKIMLSLDTYDEREELLTLIKKIAKNISNK